MPRLINIYNELKKKIEIDYTSDIIADLIIELTFSSFNFLMNNCAISNLISKVEDKEYFCFENNNGQMTRPLNKELFETDITQLEIMCNIFKNSSFKKLSKQKRNKLLYTFGMCFPCYIDVNKKGDKKTPGTFFEYFIGHIFSKKFGVNPSKQLEIPVTKRESPKYLPTDLIFQLPNKDYGFHVPVKSTTRERVIQVWAHQRILDSVYGTKTYLGILVISSETKLDTKKREVIEICLPGQWRIYQLHIAELSRIYYLDPPKTYLGLNDTFPHIPVKHLSDFFEESIISF